MKLFHSQLNRLIIAILLGTLPSITVYAAKQPWSTLTPLQKEALAPVDKQWDTMPEKQQKRLLATTKSYPQLSPELKQRFHTRLMEWSKLTPEQRNLAREKFKAFSKIPPDKQAEVKRMVLQKEAEKIAEAASSVEVTESSDDE